MQKPICIFTLQKYNKKLTLARSIDFYRKKIIFAITFLNPHNDTETLLRLRNTPDRKGT